MKTILNLRAHQDSSGRFALGACLALFFTILFVFPLSNASAQVFYQYPGAPIVKDNKPAVGPFIAVGDNLFRMSGFGRFNVTSNMDMGLEVVLDRSRSKWFAGAGGDLKYAIVLADYNIPFDWSLNAGFGFITGNDITTIKVPLGAVISRPLQLASGNVLTPYGGLYILIVHTSVDAPLGDYSDTETDVELRLGASLGLTQTMDAFSALHIDSGTKFYIGLNLGI